MQKKKLPNKPRLPNIKIKHNITNSLGNRFERRDSLGNENAIWDSVIL